MDFFSEIESPSNTKLGKISKRLKNIFWKPLPQEKNASFLASNHIKFGIKPFYPFSFNIPETFKNE